jgi:hypothetical protein
MSQEATLAEMQESYWKAFKVKDAAFYEAQAAFRSWENAQDRYVQARDALDAAAVALMSEAHKVA